MRVTDLRWMRLEGPDPHGIGGQPRTYSFCLVRVDGEGGLYGIGEAAADHPRYRCLGGVVGRGDEVVAALGVHRQRRAAELLAQHLGARRGGFEGHLEEAAIARLGGRHHAEG